VFGGQRFEGRRRWLYLDDLFEYSLQQHAWRQLDSAAGVKGAPPSGRCQMGFSAFNSSLFVIFGADHDGRKRDAFQYDLVEMTWRELTSPSFSTQASRMSFGQAALDDQIYIFGNEGQGPTCPLSYIPGESVGSETCSGPSFSALQLSSLEWVNLDADIESPPLYPDQALWSQPEGEMVPRSRETPTLVTVSNNLVMFGGRTSASSTGTSTNATTEEPVLHADVNFFRPRQKRWVWGVNLTASSFGTYPHYHGGELPLGRSYLGSATTIGSFMFVYGGYTGSRLPSEALFAYRSPVDCPFNTPAAEETPCLAPCLLVAHRADDCRCPKGTSGG